MFRFAYNYLALVVSQKKGNCIVPAFYHIAVSFIIGYIGFERLVVVPPVLSLPR